jgi:hypothetical protein
MRFAVIVFVALFMACTPRFVINKSPSVYDYRSKILAIAEISENVSINYVGNVENEFGPGAPEALIPKYLHGAIARSLKEKALFKDVVACRYSRPPVFHRIPLKLNGEQLDVSVPEDLRQVEFSGCQPDIILFLTEAHLNTSTSINTINGIPAGYNRSLDFRTQFSFVDAHTGEILAYGKESDSESAGFAVTIDNWESIVDEITDDLLLDDAFLRPSSTAY